MQEPRDRRCTACFGAAKTFCETFTSSHAALTEYSRLQAIGMQATMCEQPDRHYRVCHPLVAPADTPHYPAAPARVLTV